MARYIGIRWICCGWLLLCGLLQTVEAATRYPVSLPSTASAVSKSTTSSLSNGTLTLGGVPLEGELILAGEKNLPVRGILGGVEFGLNTVSKTATGLLRANAASLLAGAAVAALLDGIGWVMKDGIVMKPTAAGPKYTPGAGNYYWMAPYTSDHFPDPLSACTVYDIPGSSPGAQTSVLTSIHETNATCQATAWNGVVSTEIMQRYGSDCPDNFLYNASKGTCISTSTGAPVPITDDDSQTVAGYVGNQDPAWIKGLIQQLCAGATNGSSPDSCYKAMAAKSPVLTGPSSVSGGTTHSKTTTANADGTTSQTDTATSVNYGLTYGSDYIDANKTETTTVSKDGTTESTTTTSDDPDTTTDDNKSTTPATCTSADCTAPAYTPLYTKTTDTKEAALDSYSSRVQALPIFSAVGGFFKVSVGGGCPVWSVNTSLDIIGANFPINLVMDEQCQGWFVSVASFAKYCIMIVAAFFAFRTAILD